MSAITAEVKTIFGKALAIRSDADRVVYLNEACQGNSQLRAEVESRGDEGAGIITRLRLVLLRVPQTGPAGTGDAKSRVAPADGATGLPRGAQGDGDPRGDDAALRRFHAEAADLLGIPAAAPKPEKREHNDSE